VKGNGKRGKHSNIRAMAEQYAESMDYGKVPSTIKHLIRPGLNQQQANKNLQEAMRVDRDGLYSIFYHYCRNCWAAGRNWVKHSMSACRGAGTPCALECPTCTGMYHWAESCPKKK
jgi:hypothetical protein